MDQCSLLKPQDADIVTYARKGRSSLRFCCLLPESGLLSLHPWPTDQISSATQGVCGEKTTPRFEEGIVLDPSKRLCLRILARVALCLFKQHV